MNEKSWLYIWGIAGWNEIALEWADGISKKRNSLKESNVKLNFKKCKKMFESVQKDV